jgi:glyoxylate reductase
VSKIVVTGKIPNAGLEVLRKAGLNPQAWSQDVAVSREELLKQVKGAEILVTLLTEKVDSELLDAAGSQLAITTLTWRLAKREESPLRIRLVFSQMQLQILHWL